MKLRLVVAMACEARPLVAVLGLGGPEPGPYPVYRSPDTLLVVSGVGRHAAAAATGYLGGRSEARPSDPWINVGIGGHRSLAPGSAGVAHEIRDRAACSSRFPPRVATDGLASFRVITVDEVESRYPEDAVYEMEAAAFHDAALRFATSELVQVAKIVSDGPGEPAERLDRSLVEELVEAGLPLVVELAERLRELSDRLPSAPPDPGPFVERWHFTRAQRNELARLLQGVSAARAAAQSGSGAAGSISSEALALGCAGAGSASEVLDRLRSGLRRAELLLPGDGAAKP